MNHYEQTKWSAYINNKLSEDERTVIEDHLYSCDQCLQLYLEQIEQMSDTIPTLPEAEDEKDVISVEKKKIPLYQNSIIHYTVAAAITFILLTSGMFHSMIGFASAVEENTRNHHEETISKSVMDRALSILEFVDRRQKEEN